MLESFVGEIKMFGGNFAPLNWAFCDGQLLAISQNQALFSLLGTIYGGDGRNTFGLPDLRGRVPIHQGNGPGLTDKRLGQKGGAETVTLNTSQIPASRADLNIYNDVGNQTKVDKDTKSLAITGTDDGRSKTFAGSSFSTNESNAKVSNAVSLSGGGQSVNNMQPYIVINYIIATQGIFPSRP